MEYVHQKINQLIVIRESEKMEGKCMKTDRSVQHTRHFPIIVTYLTCCVLTLLLSACSFSFGSDSTKTPTPTPTTNQSSATPLTIYNGDGYTVSYPQGWKVSESNQTQGGPGKQVIFTDPAGITTFIVKDISNPNGILPTSTLIDIGLALFKNNAKNYQTVNIPATTTVAGQSWDQRSATADVTVQGTTANAKQVALATNYPANTASTKLFAIFYGSPTFTFDAENTSVFQPMLKTFKFV